MLRAENSEHDSHSLRSLTFSRRR